MEQVSEKKVILAGRRHGTAITAASFHACFRGAAAQTDAPDLISCRRQRAAWCKIERSLESIPELRAIVYRPVEPLRDPREFCPTQHKVIAPLKIGPARRKKCDLWMMPVRHADGVAPDRRERDEAAAVKTP
jgi:hypothetical protein